jgi:RHS repeat-associated protein
LTALEPAGAGTQILYSWELFDGTLGQYMNRARYYDQSIGRFSSLDSYEGDAGSPQSLHKYLYANANPESNRDPSGMMSEGLRGLLVTTGINAALYAISFGSIRFAFAKARGVSTAAAFREATVAGGWASLTAVPVLGSLISGYFLYQTARGLANGQYDDTGKLELAVDLAASLILGRAGPGIGRSTESSVSEPPPGTVLPLTTRLSILFSRLSNAPRASSPKQAFDTLAKEMNAVEDAYSGVANDPNVGLDTRGRMYPPKADNITQFPDGSWYLKTRGHRLFYNKSGGIVIIDRRSGAIEYQDGPQLPIPLYTEEPDK